MTHDMHAMFAIIYMCKFVIKTNKINNTLKMQKYTQLVWVLLLHNQSQYLNNTVMTHDMHVMFALIYTCKFVIKTKTKLISVGLNVPS
jgi:hypothetical protein